MSWKEKLKEELKSLGIIMLYFGLWFVFMIILKTLLLRQYDIEFTGLSMAFVGALIVGKVILIIDHIPLGSWIEKQPAIFDILFRTLLYSVGIIIIIILEKAFEVRHDYGGFLSAIPEVFNRTDVNQVYANSLVVICAILGFNLFTLFGKYFGQGGFRKVLLSPPPKKNIDRNKS